MKKVLIVYASKTGTTKDVAAKLADRTGAALYDCCANMLVEGQDGQVKQQPRLADYGVVLIGTAMYMGSPMKAAKRFIKAHSEEFAQKPPILFTCGVGTEEEDGEYLRKHLPEGMQPRFYRHAGGEIRPEQMSSFGRMAMKEYEKQHGIIPSINWEAVDALSRAIEESVEEDIL